MPEPFRVVAVVLSFGIGVSELVGGHFDHAAGWIALALATFNDREDR